MMEAMDRGEYEQPQQNIPYTPGQSNIQASSIVELTNPEDELRNMELMLKNCREDENGNEVPIPNTQPLLNLQGISSVLTQMKSVISRVTFLSKYDENEIRQLMMLFSDSLIQDLMSNRVKYDIKRSEDRTKIVRLAQLMVYPALKRAFEANDKAFFSRVQQDMTVRMMGQEGKKGGILSKLNPWAQK